MGKESEISWTDATFNPIWGCIKVSPGCENCYAMTWANRYGFDVWGPAKTTGRRTFGDRHWTEPLKWNREAERSGKRKRVFCSSMADVFEDHPVYETERPRLWNLIEQTPMLDWLLLTKRPENIARMMPVRWGSDAEVNCFDDSSLMPPNIWLGTSVEDQRRADERIPELLNVPARVRFLSCEPLLGPVDLSRWVFNRHKALSKMIYGPAAMNPEQADSYIAKVGIHWIIAGGESGYGARPMHPSWARALRDQCQASGIAFHFKQWGQFAPPGPYSSGELAFEDGQRMRSVGKKAAGRLLDGVEWNEFPNTVDTTVML